MNAEFNMWTIEQTSGVGKIGLPRTRAEDRSAPEPTQRRKRRVYSSPDNAANLDNCRAVPSPQKIVPSPRKFTEDPLCDVRNPRNGAAIFAVPRLNLLCSLESSMLVSTIGSASATYDAAGRMTGDGTYTYSWDAEGRLISVSGANVTSTFTYNGLSQMVEANEPGTDEEMIYDAFGRLTGHYDLITSVWSSVLWVSDNGRRQWERIAAPGVGLLSVGPGLGGLRVLATERRRLRRYEIGWIRLLVRL